MRILLTILTLTFTGCFSVPSTRFTYRDTSGTVVVVEMPKELEARNLSVQIDAQKGVATIKADSIQTESKAVVEAQGKRESKNLSAVSDVAGKVTEGAVKGAIKGAGVP